MPPAVAPRPEVRGPPFVAARQGGRDLGDGQLVQRGLHDHLAGELHPRRLQVEPEDRVPAEATEPAVEVGDRTAEEQAAETRQDRVADPSVLPRHRAVGDAPGEPVAHHEVVARSQPVDERFDRLEVVRGIRVAHDHEPSARRRDAAEEGRAVSLLRHRNDPRAQALGDLDRAVRAAVVGHDDLALDREPLEGRPGGLDARAQRAGLVQAGEDDRELDRGRGRFLWEAARVRIAEAALGDRHVLSYRSRGEVI